MINKPLVLIIDDSQVNLMLLHNLLEQQNFQVVSAKNGQDGLKLAQQLHPNIILLDIVMIGWDGYETCRRIKNEADLAKIPILFYRHSAILKIKFVRLPPVVLITLVNLSKKKSY